MVCHSFDLTYVDESDAAPVSPRTKKQSRFGGLKIGFRKEPKTSDNKEKEKNTEKKGFLSSVKKVRLFSYQCEWLIMSSFDPTKKKKKDPNIPAKMLHPMQILLSKYPPLFDAQMNFLKLTCSPTTILHRKELELWD